MAGKTYLALRASRKWVVAAGLAACTAMACAWQPEPLDRKVARLLDELQGAPRTEFGFSRAPRSHEEIFAELDRLGEAAVPSLISRFERPAPDATRTLAAMQLGKIGDRRAVRPLIRLLADPRPAVGAAGAAAIGEIGDDSAVDPLIGCLVSETSNLRSSAAAALGKIGAARAARSLASLADDKELAVRACAVEALGRLDDPRTLDSLIAALKADESPWVRDLAIRGLVRLGLPEAFPALRAACLDESRRVREDAELALSLLGQTGEIELGGVTGWPSSMLGAAD